MKTNLQNHANSLRLKTAFVCIICLGVFLLFGKELSLLKTLIMENEAYTQVAIIPLISLFFIWKSRKNFMYQKGSIPAGLAIIICGVSFSLAVNMFRLTDSVALFLKSIGILTTIYGSLALCWSYHVFKQSVFALLLLLLALPVPITLLDEFISFLQWGSAVTVDFLFSILGQAFVREGNTFHLQTLSITIAPECSGIRSTMALIITGAIAAEMFLKNWWNKVIMLIIILPLSLLKNAIRITTITMLAQYVDMSFLTHSFLHKSGGIFFYLVVLAIYFPIMMFLSRLETKQKVVSSQ